MTDYKIIKLNIARSCLRYIIRTYKINEIYIPYYYCPTVRRTILQENCKIKFYHIDKSFNPTDIFPIDSYIIYPNYFGVCSHIANTLIQKYKNIIIDNAHSLYSEPKGLASFYSLRKFFPQLKNGAILYTKKLLNESFEQDKSIYIPKELSYKELCINENLLDNETIKYISSASEKYYNQLNTEAEKQKRINNFIYWHKQLNDTNCLSIKITNTDVPFGYPYLAQNPSKAQKLANILTNKGYNIFKYWNNLPNSYEEKIFYTNLVVIPSYYFAE